MNSTSIFLADSVLEISHPHPQNESGHYVTILAALVALVVFVSSTIHKSSSDEPFMFPYIVPGLGHTLSFLKNSEALITRAREAFGNTRKPFSLMLGGSAFYIITNPYHVSAVYNNSRSLSFDIFLQKIMSEFGSRKGAIKRILFVENSHDGSPLQKSVAQLAHDFQLKQTSGKELGDLGQHIIKFYQTNLSPSSNSNVSYNGRTAISLKIWTEDLFIRAGQDAYFGPKLLEINPDLPSDLMRMDALSWQVFYQYPRMFRRECESLSRKIRSTLQTYFELPKEERPAKAWFTQALENEYRRVGLDTEDIASQMLFLYWGINTNVSKVAFWMLAHAMFAPHLIEIIREETAPAFREDGTLDGELIADSKQCPRLNSFWLECLRLSSSSTALRYITEDTVIGGKTLRKGNAIMISARQLHFNTSPSAFGDTAESFDPERFLKTRTLDRNPSFRPFGGGKTLCPGRHLAKYMTLAFVALVFRRFDVELVPGQTFPTCEDTNPAIGIMTGKDDLFIRLMERQI